MKKKRDRKNTAISFAKIAIRAFITTLIYIFFFLIKFEEVRANNKFFRCIRELHFDRMTLNKSEYFETTKSKLRTMQFIKDEKKGHGNCCSFLWVGLLVLKNDDFYFQETFSFFRLDLHSLGNFDECPFLLRSKVNNADCSSFSFHHVS